MLFNSVQFAIFFPIVTALFFLSPARGRVPLLLAASCLFYMAFIPKYILILVVLIVVDYSAGIAIERATGTRRKLFLTLSLCANVGMLAFFKYFNFLNDNAAAIAHALDWNYSVASLRIILPIGLSFHTFQSMSYTIEVYRGRVPAERSFLVFALYVLFYPQLVAGPIERPQNLLHQFRTHQEFSRANLVQGAELMLSGLFKKIVIADRIALVVNAVYAQPANYLGIQLLGATCLFAVQIYCDFAGYTEIARGAAKVMGFDLMVNFNRPYMATSIADFWRRWHISLSTWFRDYVYIPLGGNRVGRARTCLNLAVVFLVSGLWHGANWTFVIWGAIHALAIVTYFITETPRAQARKALGKYGARVMSGAGWLLTSTIVVLAWVFFRAPRMSDALLIIRRIVTDFGPPVGSWTLHPGIDGLQFGIALLVIGGLFVTEVLASRAKPFGVVLAEQPRWIRWSSYYAFGVLFVVLLLLNPQTTPQPFVYFQF